MTDKTPNRGRLWTLAFMAAVIGGATSLTFWSQMHPGGDMEWGGWIIVGMMGLIAYSIAFYFGHRFFEGSLDRYIVSDTFGKKHDWIDLETETRDSGDAKIDGWVAHYKFIRTVFAMGILPLLASVYLFWFS